jgi:hypothetical protein
MSPIKLSESEYSFPTVTVVGVEFKALICFVISRSCLLSCTNVFIACAVDDNDCGTAGVDMKGFGFVITLAHSGNSEIRGRPQNLVELSSSSPGSRCWRCRSLSEEDQVGLAMVTAHIESNKYIAFMMILHYEHPQRAEQSYSFGDIHIRLLEMVGKFIATSCTRSYNVTTDTQILCR